MPGDPNPVVPPFEAHDDQQIIAFHKLHTRITVADADEIRNTDYSGQFAGLFVRELTANFNLDTGDVSADDGVNVIIDAAGNHFVRAEEIESPETQRTVTAAGTVTVTTTDTDIIIIDKTVGAPTTVQLPSAAAATKPVRIVDGKYDAETNHITILPAGTEKIMGGSSYVIDSNGASIKLTPRANGTGWI